MTINENDYNYVICLLLSMVEQYCRRGEYSPKGGTFSHDFMSTGEEVFEFLVDHKYAEWCDNGVDICNLIYPEWRK